MTLLLLILSGLLGFVLVIILIPPILRVAHAKKLFDFCDKRKKHKGVIPPLGGIAIFVGFLLSSLIFTDGYSSVTLKYLIGASVLMLFIGLKDDLMNISAKKKLIVQIIAVLLLFIYGNVRLINCYGFFGMDEVNIMFSLFLTLFVMLSIINAFNLIDGIDGLASGLAIVASVFLGVWFFVAGHFTLAVISIALAGSLCGFFIFNVFGKKSKLFMGDTGSLIIGLIISTLIIKFNELNTNQELACSFSAAPVISFSLVIVPLIDTLRVITIRLMNKKSPFAPDNNHIHHRLLSIYSSHLKVTLKLVGANILFILFAVLLPYISNSTTIQFLILLFTGVILSFLPSYILKWKNTKKSPKRLSLSHY